MTIKAAVLGWPVEHSLSPRLHGYWLTQHNIDGAYEKIPVEPGTLGDALSRMREEGYAGCNLTIPHKETAMDLMDDLSPTARRIGAVNTVVFRRDGVIYGDNTDGFGFIENLTSGAPGWQAGDPAVIIGAGGATRAIVSGLIDQGVNDIRIMNRTVERAEALANEFSDGIVRVSAHSLTSTEAPDGTGLLINASSLGMEGEPPLELDLSPFPTDAVVTDIVYTPLETDLLKRAAARGHPTVDGLGMLLHQGRPGFEYWFGVLPEVTQELRSYVLKTA